MITFIVVVKLLEGVYNQLVNVPLENPLSYLYVVLNAFLQLIALLL